MVISAHHVAAVRARVEKDVDLIIRGPSDDDLLFAHPGSNEVAGLGDLTLVAHKQPHSAEDLFELLLVDVRVTENDVVNYAVARVDEFIHCDICSRHDNLLTGVSFAGIVSPSARCVPV